MPESNIIFLTDSSILDDFLIAQRFGEISYLKPKNSEFKSTNLDDLDSIINTSK